MPDGEVGELTFRGPSVIRSYLSDEHSATAFTSDGFCRSGDLGHVETIAGRRCYVVDGRLKDQISRGGEKVMAAELELLLHDHPEVREVAAIGVPDPALGERICVVVVPEDPGVDPEELRKRLVEHLDQRDVAKFKWPERLVLVDELPKTGVGKVQKDVLRSWVESGWRDNESEEIDHDDETRGWDARCRSRRLPDLEAGRDRSLLPRRARLSAQALHSGAGLG